MRNVIVKILISLCLFALYPVAGRATIDDCDTNTPHPGFIDIYENDILLERIPFSNYPMPFETSSMETMDGKWCILRMPIVAVRKYVSYYDSKGNSVSQKSPIRKTVCASIQTYDKDSKVIAYHDAFCQNIKKGK
jgi:hypothetical protein